VGLELYAAEGPAIVRWLRGEGKQVFVDLKLHDIPNTVRGAARLAWCAAATSCRRFAGRTAIGWAIWSRGSGWREARRTISSG